MAQNLIDNNKRIAKNTLLLYLRMIIVTLLSLVTVKYTLKILGVEDYGIYNIVGGVVSFLTIVTGTLTSATQRFLAYDLGRRNMKSYNNTFNMLLLIYGLLCIILFLFFEILGYPIIYSWLMLPSERLDEAYIVYHLSVLAFIFNVMVIPFSSSIIANEKMGVYAYLTIIDTISKLAILGFLVVSPFDKLISYASATLIMVLLVDSMYIFYNQKKISITPIYYFWDKSLFKKLIGYTAWSLFGSISGVMSSQGLSILMNLFFGVTVNAAKAIADKIKNIVFSFVQNFYMAVSPQIIKTYAAGDYIYTTKLAFRSTKLSYYLLFIITVPTILLLEKILKLWLADSCTYDMIIFTKLSLIFALVNVFESPITFMVRATGDIKRYQISVGIITILIVPFAYILFVCGLPAYTGFIAEIIIYAIAQIVRVYIARKSYKFLFIDYIKEAILWPALITAVTVIISCILIYFNINIYWVTVFVTSLTLLFIWFFGLHRSEKTIVKKYIKNKIRF